MSDPTEMPFAKRAAITDDDDNDGDDQPSRKKKDAKSKGPNWPLIIGGGCGFLTLLICIGTGVLGWMAYTKTRDVVGRVQDDLQKANTRFESRNNLKEIGLAMHGYHDANKRLPDHASLEPNTGKPLLSWRVAILPYIDENALFPQIRQNEAWDSPHNKQFWTKIPKTYQLPGKPADGNTYYQVFAGRGSAFPKAEGPQFKSRMLTMVGITDGTSNTIFVVEAANPVNWMKPDDIPFDEKPKSVPMSVVGNHWGDNTFMAVMGDGTVRSFPRTTTPQMLHNSITAQGGEIVMLD